MQFGIFTVGDVTTDPTTGRTPTEHERIKSMVAIARQAEDIGLDVFATGEHHNPPFVPSSPTTMLGYIAAQTEHLILSTATTLITTNDPVKIAEDFAMLQHLADGRVDLMLGRGNTGPVYPWFGKDIRQGIELAIENYHLLHRLWREDVVDWSKASSAPPCRDSRPPRGRWTACRRSCGTARSGARRSPSRRRTTATGSSPITSSGPRTISSGWSTSTGSASRITGTAPRSRRSSASAARSTCAATPRTRCAEFRPYFDNAPVYGHGPSLEDFTGQTPLTVGSPQEVIDKTLTFREHFGDYQRQLFLMDHAGLPLKTVLEQLDLLGEVVPVLRRELDAKRPASVPDGPTHEALVAASVAEAASDEASPDEISTQPAASRR